MFFETSSGSYTADLLRPIDISIALDFGGQQPSCYGASPANAEALRMENFVGDVREGGSCNCETYQLTPHCNGTHTECVGHITLQRLSVRDMITDAFVPSTLVSIAPTAASESRESYSPPKERADQMITREAIERVLKSADRSFLKGLVIRTLPSTGAKRARNYARQPAPFFSLEAMQYIVEKNVRHLVVDVPSVDRASDEGKLSCHHIYWEMAHGTHANYPPSAAGKSITELAFIPENVADGRYMLNLQIAPFAADAAPSRPLLFPIEGKNG